jgi:hypothetical protein
VADLPGKLGVRLEATDGPVLPFSTALVRRGKSLILIPKRVLESPLGPDALSGACARVWYVLRGYRPSRQMVRGAAARLAVPTALVQTVLRGEYRAADVACIVGCTVELVYLRLALEGSRLDDTQRDRHTAYLEEGLRCLGGHCRVPQQLHNSVRYRDCAEVIWSMPGV